MTNYNENDIIYNGAFKGYGYKIICSNDIVFAKIIPHENSIFDVLEIKFEGTVSDYFIKRVSFKLKVEKKITEMRKVESKKNPLYFVKSYHYFRDWKKDFNVKNEYSIEEFLEASRGESK